MGRAGAQLLRYTDIDPCSSYYDRKFCKHIPSLQRVLPVQMVKFFFFVIINRFSIDEDFSFAKGFDGDLFRTFIFNFTVLLQDAKQMETTKTDMEIGKN